MMMESGLLGLDAS